MINSLFWLGLTQAAHAAPINKTICFRYNTDFTDAASSVGDHFVTSNGIYPAKFALARVIDTSGGGNLFYNYLGSNGCVTLSMESTHSHTLVLYSEVQVPSGAKIKAVGSRAAPNTFIAQVAGYFPSGSGTVNVIADASNVNQSWANVMMAASHAVTRHTAGWPTNSGDYLFYVEDTDVDDDCGAPGVDTCLQYVNKAGYFLANPGVQIDPISANASIRSKYILIHEMGHLLNFKLNCDGSPLGCVQLFTMEVDYGAAADQCRVYVAPNKAYPGSPAFDPSHAYNSKEYQSAAVVEGWAHFVSAYAFNNPNVNTCRIQPNGVIWWNYDTNGDGSTYFDDAGWSNSPFSCEGNENGTFDIGGAEHTVPPSPVDARDIYGDFCVVSGKGKYNFNRGVEVDWTRFWWDVVGNGHGVDFKKAGDILREAESFSWCKNGDNSLQCATANKPAERVKAAFSTLGVSSAYNAEKNNGVER